MQTSKIQFDVNSRAWYAKYPLDAYALGPARFDTYVSAAYAAQQFEDTFGKLPAEMWTSGSAVDVPRYEVELQAIEWVCGSAR